MLAKDKISNIVEKWYILEPLFFSVWLLHKVEPTSHIKTIRVQNGFIEYNPDFIDSLSKNELESVMKFEAMRIVLKHPYSRKKNILEISYLASNITIQEYLKLKELDFPTSKAFFKKDDYNLKYFEFYYEKIIEETQKEPNNNTCNQNSENSIENKINNTKENRTNNTEADKIKENNKPLKDYCDEKICGYENSKKWDKSEYQEELINEKIKEAEISNSWGSLTDNIKEKILATLKPKINYKSILKAFRGRILSSKRILTRMKPSRRYDFSYMGYKNEFTTKILFAVDVSGSINSYDLKNAFSIINTFFKYGIKEIFVICFDTKIKGEKLTLKKAVKEVTILGRGGTSFEPVIQYINKDTSYDGLIIFTDGYSSIPSFPKNRKTKILWLFNNEQNYNYNKDGLKKIGMVTFLKEN